MKWNIKKTTEEVNCIWLHTFGKLNLKQYYLAWERSLRWFSIRSTLFDELCDWWTDDHAYCWKKYKQNELELETPREREKEKLNEQQQQQEKEQKKVEDKRHGGNGNEQKILRFTWPLPLFFLFTNWSSFVHQLTLR